MKGRYAVIFAGKILHVSETEEDAQEWKKRNSKFADVREIETQGDKKRD